MGAKISRARRLAQAKIGSFKAVKLETDDVLAIISYEKGETEGDKPVPNDYLLCLNKNTGKNIKLTLRDFNAMIPSDGSNLVRLMENGEDEAFPSSVTIKSSTPRLDRNDKPYFPAFAYNGANDFYNSLGSDTPMEWDTLVATGVKEGATFPEVQNYTVVTTF